MKRRKFINRLGLGTTAAVLPNTVLSFTPSFTSEKRTLNFGIVADVHKDLMPDANDRLEKFISEANHRKVDFIIQLGDFCMADRRREQGFYEYMGNL